MNINLSNLVSVSEIQKNYRQIFDRAKRTKEPIILMRENEPDIALIDVKTLDTMQKTIAEYESWKETQEILNDPQAMADIKAGEADIKAGRVHDWETVRKELGWDV